MSSLRSAIPVLSAVDLPADVAFWVNTLGFQVRFTTEGIAGVTRDGVTLYIGRVVHRRDTDQDLAWVVVSDLDGLHAEWSTCVGPAGADDRPAMTAVAQRTWGREFVVRDPAGNLVHFLDGAAE